MADKITNVTAENFQAEVLESPIPVLVDFYADWCGPCRALSPTLVEMAGDSGGKYKIVKVDTDDQQALAAKYGVSALPTLLTFKAGKMSDKKVGGQPKAKLLESLS